MKQETKTYQEIFIWNSTARLVSALAVGLVLLYLWTLSSFELGPLTYLTILMGVYLLVILFVRFILKNWFKAETLLYANLILDVAFIQCIIYFFAEEHGRFLFLFAMPVIGASLISIPAVAVIAMVSLITYAGFEFLIENNSIHYISMSHTLFTGEFGDIGGLILLLSVISFQTWFYLSRIQKKDKEMIRMKDDFLFRTVHDLRSPTTAIRFVLEKYKHNSSNDPGVKRDTKTVRELAERILLLVNDLLSAMRSDRRGIEIAAREVRLPNLILEILKTRRPSIKKAGLKVEYQPGISPPSVQGDERRLREVFDNLISNATKYNLEKGVIKIEHAVEGDYVKTSVTNPVANPLDAQVRSKLFSPFFRGTADPKIAGTGLGLYICKQLVEKMNGKIAAKITGREVTFEVYLPVFKPG